MKTDTAISGWSFYDSPRYPWSCSKCKFQFGVATHFKDDSCRHHDVYLSCSPRRERQYIVVNSAKGDSEGDYSSGIDLKSLFSHAIAHMYRL